MLAVPAAHSGSQPVLGAGMTRALPGRARPGGSRLKVSAVATAASDSGALAGHSALICVSEDRGLAGRVFCRGTFLVYLAAKDTVNHLVMPAPGAERGATQYALASEPGLLQCPLLTDIGDFSRGFYPVDLRVGEQVSRQQPLGLRAVAAAPDLHGGAPRSSTARPHSTRCPLRRALAASSSASRGLPIPGGPATTTSRPRPASASASQPCNAASSWSRPARLPGPGTA